jgi:FkbM family methyltransferase
MRKLIKRLPFIRSAVKRWKRLQHEQIKQLNMNVDGVQLTFDTSNKYSNHWFIPRYLNGRVHEPNLTKLLCTRLKPTDVFIDVGAHLGYFTCLASKIVSHGEVHAFEMDAKCIPLLEANLKLNNCGNVKVNNVALAAEDGKVFIPNEKNPNSELQIVDSAVGNAVCIESTKLDTYCSTHGIVPNLVKIDAEGAELKILRGFIDTLRHNVPTLFVEIHCDKLEKQGGKPIDCLTLLNDLGYEMCEIVDHRKAVADFKSLQPNSPLAGNVMVMATKK